MLSKLKFILTGSPLPTFLLAEKKLNKFRALATFSPDALSSIAYANQEIYLGLAVAGAAGLSYSFPIAIAITLLLAIVALSYTQTIQAYPSGGGSYVVARENLGTLPGQVAAAALLVNYVLTAAVSLTAGVSAIASAFPTLWPYQTWIALGLLALLTLANLRGARETGTLMAVPVYGFLTAFLPVIAYGLISILRGGAVAIHPAAIPASEPLTWLIVLRAFSAGCTALTGIEAISNGVPSFRHPEVRNAQITMAIMALLMGVLFLGSVGVTQYLGVTAGEQETILSALARRLLDGGPLYFLVQAATLAILAVGANTSFAGFPRVTAILANDKFLPRQMNMLGDRLVYTNGILILSGLTALLIVVFKGDSHALIPLFAIGAFLAYTLSQAGMVRHWIKLREKFWLGHAFINGLGAGVTGVTLLIISYYKFTQGAWMAILVIPLIVAAFNRVRTHYQEVGEQLSLRGLPPSLRPMPQPRVVIPVSGVHRGLVEAVNFARSISDRITAVYIDIEPGRGFDVRKEWQDWFPDIPLVIVPSPYRSLIEPLLNFLDRTDREAHDGKEAVLILPEFIPARPWQDALHNQSARLIKNALIYQREKEGVHRIVIDVPYHLKERHRHPARLNHKNHTD
jgi:amino acid transporter